MIQRLVLVYTGPEHYIWVLLLKGGVFSLHQHLSAPTLPTSLCVCSAPAAPVLHLPAAAAVRTHAVTWAADLVVQDALPSAYYDHDVNTLGVLSLQHSGRQQGWSDGLCFNTLVALVPDYVQLNEDGEKVEVPEVAQPPPVENPQYVWHQVQKESLREKLLEKTKNTSILPIHSLY